MSQANRATTKDFMGALSDGFRVCMTCLRHKADVVPPERPPANPTQPPTNPPTQPPVNPPTQPPANPPQNPSQNPPNTPQHSYYIKNISSGVIHTNLCGSARNMAERNRAITNDFMGALSDGFRVCMTCLRHKADVVPPERPPAQPPTNPPTNPPNTPQHSYYVKNTNSRVIHTNLCSSARNMAERNRAITNDFMGALSNGFRVCMTCLRHKADVVPPPAQPDHSKQNGGRYVVHIPTGRIHLPTCGSAVHMHESNRRIVNDFAVAVSNGYIPCLHCFGGDCQHNHSGCCDTRFILNTNSRVIHLHTCGAARNIAERNRGYTDHLEDALLNGFRTCNTCMRN
ncbi:MAG: hypothetical protein FWB93_05580, partial [Oscillospiraceae bacterium]|nr:hypothetical protein [Oscillospiraceae bacterium]